MKAIKVTSPRHIIESQAIVYNCFSICLPNVIFALGVQNFFQHGEIPNSLATKSCEQAVVALHSLSGFSVDSRRGHGNTFGAGPAHSKFLVQKKQVHDTWFAAVLEPIITSQSQAARASWTKHTETHRKQNRIIFYFLFNLPLSRCLANLLDCLCLLRVVLAEGLLFLNTRSLI